MKILLAVDGSDESQEAVGALAGFAPADELTLLHVIHVPGLSYPTIGAGLAKDLSMAVEQAMREEGEEVLKRALANLPPHPGPITKRLEVGDPAEIILNVAKETQSDLIMLGARGFGAFREYMFGSVSHRVMLHAPCSTFIVKKAIPHIRDVLLPIERQEDTEVAETFLAKHPFREPVMVKVLHAVPIYHSVWSTGIMIPEHVRKEMMAYAEELTGGLATKLQAQGYQTKALAVKGMPVIRIEEEVKTSTPDLIMMRTHSRVGMSRFLLGSVSHSVVHHLACSVLLLR